VLNAADEEVTFRLPHDGGADWELMMDTCSADPPLLADGARHRSGSDYRMAGRSFILLRLTRE